MTLSSVQDYVSGIRAGDRAVLARALTLVESRHPKHQPLAEELLEALVPDSGLAHRIGISGAPGVGKSTLIEALGLRLVARGHKVAVLAVDPSSTRSGGSILADKTRMPELCQSPQAFIRPSPSRGELGGVTRDTEDAIVVFDAAGFDFVLVETVGVGQSEAHVRNLVDCLVLLLAPAGGDEIQGIKRGILELVDVVFVNKSDGSLARAAEDTRHRYASALAAQSGAPVLIGSALHKEGLDAFFQAIEAHISRPSEERKARRAAQRLQTLWTRIDDELKARVRAHPKVKSNLASVEAALREGRRTVRGAARELLDHLGL